MCTEAAGGHAPAAGERFAPLVRDARRGLVRTLQAALNKHSVAFGHWAFLRILWTHDGINQRKLSDLAGVMEPTTFAALQSMERLGYITRQRRPENRKNIYVHLTASGKALEAQLLPMAMNIDVRASRGISAADKATTLRTLRAIIDNLAEDMAETPCRHPRSQPAQLRPRVVASAAAQKSR